MRINYYHETYKADGIAINYLNFHIKLVNYPTKSLQTVSVFTETIIAVLKTDHC